MSKREQIVAEVKTWIGTSFHHEGRVKHAGVDCGMLLLEVFERVGIAPHVVPPHYSPDFMLHRGEEWYLGYVLRYADPIEPPGRPGDVILFRNGRTLSHGGIVTEWPLFVHASILDGCVLEADASLPPYSLREMKLFSPKGV